ncbi:MAG: LacI family DNA-binding transcriptional regulator [Pontiella sp.]
MAVSQKQIAERVGVSIALVSRVLSGKAREVGIADSTIVRVMNVAAEMGYVPSAAALTLKGKATKTIGVVVYDFKDPFFGAIIEALQAQAHKHGYSLVLSGFRKRVPEAVDLAPLHKHAIDGLIILGSEDKAEWLDGFRTMPVSRIGHGSSDENSVRVAIDENHAADQVLQHLVNKGHKNIVFIGENFLAHHLRFQAMEKRAVSLGCSIRCITSSSWAFAAGLDGTRKILETEGVDALICATDKIAMGALHALHDTGTKIPVTGFDDIPAAVQFIPPITTMRQPIEEMAKLAFESVIHSRTFGDILLKGLLMVRNSA